jgi:hypothetical protein
MLGLVVRVSRCAESVRAGVVAGEATSLEGARDPCVTPRARDASSASSAAEADAGRSGTAGFAEPLAAAGHLGGLPGQARDAAALAPPTCRAPLDVRPSESRRPPLERSVRERILRLARENPSWGYKRIVGELKAVGVIMSATSVRKVLAEAGVRPAPEQGHSSWRTFLRQQAASVLACDFLTVETAFLQRINVLFFMSLTTRRIESVACLDLRPPEPDERQEGAPVGEIRRRDRLAALIHEYYRAAA